MEFNIYSEKESFVSIEDAAMADNKLDWFGKEGSEHEACTTCFAAMELESMLNKVPDTKAVLSDYEIINQNNNIICLATAKQYKKLAPCVQKIFGKVDYPEKEQSFIIKTELASSAKKTAYLILGSDRAGVLYGAYELLNTLGFEWFSPDQWDDEIPVSLSALPEINRLSAPSFQTRGFFAAEDKGGKSFLLWMARHKLNQWVITTKEFALCKKLGMKLMGGAHDLFDKYLSPTKYFKRHPEWYGLVNGKRSNNICGNLGDNICFSNHEVCEYFSGQLVNDLADGAFKGADFINIWPLDNGKYCECSKCKKLRNPSSHIMTLAYYCRKTIKKAYQAGYLNRDVKLVVPAYHETLEPPLRAMPKDFDYDGIIISFFPIERCYAHYFDDSSCEEINKDMLNYWEKWTKDKKRPWNMLMGEYYNVSAFAGMAVPVHKTMLHDIPYYHKSGALHMHYMHVTTAKWGTLALTNCLFAALLWNSGLNGQNYVSEFFRKRYHASAQLLENFYSTLQLAMKNSKALKHYVGMPRHGLYFDTLQNKGSSSKKCHIFKTRHFTYNTIMDGKNNAPSIVETLMLLSQAENIIDKALLECEDSLVAERLIWDTRQFRYTKNMVLFLYYFIRVRLFENKDFKQQAKLEAMALRDVGETLRRECEMTKYIRGKTCKISVVLELYTNGLSATWLSKAYAKIMHDYGLKNSGSKNIKFQKEEKDKALA
jgi:Domain of unknown function (DUF4838)